ncbi:hypothetical protein XELAEV_18013809mg [Xenopus laevis]|nr:hypothetical protein XELAEV_18013809mg [Xenopus laevis]
MQSQQAPSFANQKTHLEINLDDERQELLEEQKLCRIRAQKLSIETNRRRKALAEKRREEEVKEQRFRETVLQQRKQKLQEVTEKFLRAHLPPSQRRRTAYVIHKKPTPKLEDALNQIQGSVTPSFYYLSNNTHPSHTRNTDTPSSISSAGHGTWHKKQQSATKLGFEKTFQEKSAIHLDSNQLYFQHRLEEAQRLLEEQHLSNLKNFHREVEHLARSESLSSVDSLEEEKEVKTEENIAAINLQNAFSAIDLFPLNNVTVEASNEYQVRDENVSALNGLSHTTPNPLSPDRMATNIMLYDQDPDVLIGHMQKDIMTNAFTQNGILFPQKPPIASTQNKENVREKTNPWTAVSEHDSREHSLKILAKPTNAWGTPEPTPNGVVQTLVPQEKKDPTQPSEKPPITSQPFTTPIVISSTEWVPYFQGEHKSDRHPEEMFYVASAGNGVETNNTEMRHGQHKSVETPSEKLSVQESSPIFTPMCSNNSKGTENPPHLPLRDMQVGFPSQCKKAKINLSGKDEKRFLKGILKKGSKYELGYSRALGISKILQTGDAGTNAIRDSIELVKEKENKKTGKKKLRWLDEIDKIMTEKEASNVERNVSASPKSNIEHSESLGHQVGDPAPFGSTAETEKISNGHCGSVHSTGFHVAKQAWQASKGLETSATDCNNNRHVPKGKTKIIRRPKSAKNQSSVLHKHRKGTIIRPQSASEASKIVRSQGKIMMPRPPPRPVSGKVNNPTVANSTLQSQNRSHSGNNMMLPSNLVVAKDVGTFQGSAPSAGNLLAANPYNSSTWEPSTKSAMTLQDSLPMSTKRYPVYGENGIRLDHTPTDDEIAVLWQGVRTALTHKHSGTGTFQPGDQRPSMQPTRTNLSHVIIDGGNLLTNMKSFSRINGYFSPPTNGHLALTRRKQILDNNENKHRALMEQRRMNPNSTNWRHLQTENEHTLKINPLASAREPVPSAFSHSGEVSESTAQFMLAEDLVETSATEGEILAEIQAMSSSRKGLQMHKGPHGTCLSALSQEEQKLLQSLDRLNQRLQNVQEAIVKYPTSTMNFPGKSQLNLQQSPSHPSDTPAHVQRFRSLSADPRIKIQRRY